MAFKELGGSGGNVLKWQTPGQVVQGRLVGTKPGKVFNGRPTTLAIIDVGGGVQQTIPLTTVLESRFLEHNLPAGTVVRITYIGPSTTKNGQPFKDFKLEVDDGGSSAPAPAHQAPAPSQQPQQPTSLYDVMAGKLREKDGAAAGAQLSALKAFYPDENARLIALTDLLRQKGVTV